MKWFLNTFTYWSELFSEIRIWWIFRKTCRQKDNLQKINDQDLRVDWLGRVYGVINMPEEVVGAAPQVQQAYVMQQLSKWGPLTNELGISDIIYPEMARIPNSAAYLVVMWPQYEAFALFPILGNMIKSAAVATGLFFLGRVVYINFHYVIELFNKLVGLAGL
jgi:hypothetical protein